MSELTFKLLIGALIVIGMAGLTCLVGRVMARMNPIIEDEHDEK